MLYGDELAKAIEELGLTERGFALRCRRPDGSTLSPQAINDMIRKRPPPKSDDVTRTAVEAALERKCRTCGQYTEKENAWNHPEAEPESGGRKRKT